MAKLNREETGQMIFADNGNTDEVECFGRFDIKQRLCRKYCAMRLRCALEQLDQSRLDQLEDLMTAYEITSKIQ